MWVVSLLKLVQRRKEGNASSPSPVHLEKSLDHLSYKQPPPPPNVYMFAMEENISPALDI